MSLKAGIVGLPNVGKSLLFNTLTNNNVPSENYPFCTIEPNVGTVAVPDYRLEQLSKLSQSKKTVYALQDFVDIAGIVKGASKGDGLGNKFLSEILEADIVLQVVRLFADKDVLHVNNSVDPRVDIEVINTELILKDLEILDKHLNNLLRLSRTEAWAKGLYDFLQGLRDFMNSGGLASNFMADKEAFLLNNVGARDYFNMVQLLTLKPFIYVLNISDNEVSSTIDELVDQFHLPKGNVYLPINVKIENEISKLGSKEDRLDFMQMYGIKDSALDKLIELTYEKLNKLRFYTTGEQESRAWTFNNGMTARDCAGIIHTDFYNKFIAAEVIDFDTFVTTQGYKQAKELGKLRLESRDYLVKDGDIMVFRHN